MRLQWVDIKTHTPGFNNLHMLISLTKFSSLLLRNNTTVPQNTGPQDLVLHTYHRAQIFSSAELYLTMQLLLTIGPFYLYVRRLHGYTFYSSGIIYTRSLKTVETSSTKIKVLQNTLWNVLQKFYKKHCGTNKSVLQICAVDQNY